MSWLSGFQMRIAFVGHVRLVYACHDYRLHHAALASLHRLSQQRLPQEAEDTPDLVVRVPQARTRCRAMVVPAAAAAEAREAS